MYRNQIKRLLDIFLSACGILCLSWLLLLLAVAIKLDSPGPVFFRQKLTVLHYVLFPQR